MVDCAELRGLEFTKKLMFLGDLGWYCAEHAIQHITSTGEELESDLEEDWSEEDIRHCCVCEGDHTIADVYHTRTLIRCDVCSGTGRCPRPKPYRGWELCEHCNGNGFTFEKEKE